jgi:DNA-binding NarL/FixJ family response regulator
MRIVFADDHFLVRATLNRLLRELGSADAPVRIDEEESLAGVRAQLAAPPLPELIILDLSMPGMNGADGIVEVRGIVETVPIVVLSGFADHETILNCFRLGAAGFIPKTTGQTEMLAALRMVMGGQRYVPPTLVDQALVERKSHADANGPAVETPSNHSLPLTPRECTILRALANGKRNKEIARDLGLEEVTIKFALRRLYKKINATNRASAVRLGIEAGLV